MTSESRLANRRRAVGRRIGARGMAVLAVLHLPLIGGDAVRAQVAPGGDPRYRTRASDCRVDAPAGEALPMNRRDSGALVDGYTAARVIAYEANARGLAGGEIVVCTEYGRVEIADSDDQAVRVQVRLEAFGEGAAQSGAAASRVLDETDVRVHLTAHEGRLMARVWHATLGFSAPGAQPASVGIRILVPINGAYRVASTAYHGSVAVRRLTLAGGVFRGRVGDKFKGIPGYLGFTELDNVTLGGDVEMRIDGGALTAPILAKVRVASSSGLTVTTGGNVDIAVQPHPSLGVRALGESNTGAVHVLVNGATTSALSPGEYAIRRQAESPDFSQKPVRLDVRAASAAGRVNLASMPAAPLAP